MRKQLILILFAAVILTCPTRALADYTFYYTGDNIIQSILVNGSAITPGSNAANWQSADSFTLTPGPDYTIYFRLKNLDFETPTGPTGSDPMALLAKATDSSGSTVLTTNQDNWQVLSTSKLTTAEDPTGAINWLTPSYAVAFGGGAWDGRGPTILSDASWISLEGEGGNDNPADIWLKTTLSTVPLPSALWLLGTGLLGLVGFRRFAMH